MLKLRRVNRNLSGFTLVELLMAVLLIAILATIAITQFTNFSKDAKNAATKENLGILRNAIQRHFGTIRLRCNPSSTLADAWPALEAVNKNDITEGSASASATNPCTTGDIATEADRTFVAGGIPVNPWSDSTCTDVEKRQVIDGSGVPAAEMNIGTKITTVVGTGCGWAYNAATGKIKANSNKNGGYPASEGLYESAY